MAMNMKRKLKIFGIVLFIILSAAAAVLYPAFVKAKMGAYIVNHIVLYKHICKHQEQYNCYPVSLEVLGLQNDEFAREKVTYNLPQEDSGDDFIVLRSKMNGIEIITLKNGEIKAVENGQVVHRTWGKPRV